MSLKTFIYHIFTDLYLKVIYATATLRVLRVLARAIYSEGVKNVAAGSQAAVDNVVKFLSAQNKTITTTCEIAQVATISANGDTHVGNLIAQAMEKVGKDSVITVKEGRTIEDEIEITEGMRFDRGFISPYFVTDVKLQKVEFTFF